MTNEFIAYFSMEIALEPGMPTYSGGLGVLAGDTIRSAADLKLPMLAMTLLHRQGYFRQRLDPTGWQTEEAVGWDVRKFCQELPARVSVGIEGRTVHLRAWCYTVNGIGGHGVPVFLLDADLPENSPWDRTLTHHLYGGNFHYRLCQEIILGIGGVRMLRALGYHEVRRFHMNEGHAALLGLELLDERALDHFDASVSQWLPDEFKGLFDHLVEWQADQLRTSRPGNAQHLRHQTVNAVKLPADRFRQPRLRTLLQQKIDERANGHEGVFDFMGHPGGERADAGQAVEVAQLDIQLPQGRQLAQDGQRAQRRAVLGQQRGGLDEQFDARTADPMHQHQRSFGRLTRAQRQFQWAAQRRG